MTKVLAKYKLTHPLNEQLLEAIERVRSIYGMRSVQLNSDMTQLTVDFDASRLQLPEVDHALLSAGLPVLRTGE